MTLFVVMRGPGSEWRSGAPLEGQPLWQDHGRYMDRLEEEGFVVLGGPLDGGSDVLLIVQADDETEIHHRLSSDPWCKTPILPIHWISRWQPRLNSIGFPLR